MLKTMLDLPKNVTEGEIAPYLSLQDLNHLTIASKGLNTLFKKPFTERKITVAKLLQNVAFGHQEHAAEILQANPALLLEKGNVTDYSDRSFEKITAFQYALWALDRHMWEMILGYFPPYKISQAAQQLQELESGAAEFVNKHGKHFDFAPLIQALKARVDFVHTQNLDDDDAIIELWCHGVGREQRKVPVHIANEYCQPYATFNPTPSFMVKTLHRMHKIYNYDEGKFATWFPLKANSGLGFDYAFIRNNRATTGSHRMGKRCHVIKDLQAITTLFEVRTQELTNLKERLLISPNRSFVESI